jgi:hypothetical protein
MRISAEPTELEKSVEEIFKKMMADKPLSKGVEVSLTRELQASPSTRRRSIRVNPMNEKQSKHRGDLANAKRIPSILPNYIPPLVGAVNRDSIPHDYEYTLITAYILKGIRVVGSQLGQIPLLKNNDFNLDDRKKYVMLAPHRYLTKTTGKKHGLPDMD